MERGDGVAGGVSTPNQHRNFKIHMKTYIRLSTYIFIHIFTISAAYATTWIDVEKSSPSGYFQIDADSIKKVENEIYTARWQTSTMPALLKNINTGSIDCSQAHITLHTSEQIRTDQISSRFNNPTTIKNYTEKKKYIDNKPRDLDRYEELEQFKFPSPGSPELTMIRSICQQESPSIPNENIVRSLQDKLQCNSQTLKSPLCNKDTETQEIITLLFLRIGQAKASCPINLEDSTAIINDSIYQSIECGKTANCKLENTTLTASGISDDLSRALSGKNCSFIQATLDRIKKDTETRASISEFKSCVSKSIIKLDDHTSPADNIAKAAFATCRSILAGDLSSSKIFEQNIEPSIIALVLSARNKPKERREAPTKKKPTNQYL